MFVVGFSHFAQAQHLPLYSMYMFNGLVVNPAYAGQNGALTTMLHFRDQWSSFEGHPTTYTLAVDSPLKNKKYNLGVIFSYDQFAITKHTEFLQSFAYRLSLTNNSEFSVGLQAGLTYIRMDWSSLNAPPEDQVFAVNPKGNFLPKIGIGIKYIYKNFYISASIPQKTLKVSNDPAVNYFTKPVYYFLSGFSARAGNSLQVKPSLLFKFLEPNSVQVDLNTMITYKQFVSVGASYRIANAFVLLTEVKLNQLRFGYAYDYYLNSLKNVSKGSHELMVKYEFRYLMKVTDPRNFY